MGEPKPSKMKLTVERSCAQEILQSRVALTHLQPSYLSDKPISARKLPRRKTKTFGTGVRLKKESGKQNSRPETPLLRWKFDESNEKNDSVVEEEEEEEEEEQEKLSGEVGRKIGQRVRPVVSARKLGAGLWRLHLPEFKTSGLKKLGLQFEDGHLGGSIHNHRVDRVHASPVNNRVHSPHYASVAKNGLLHKHDPSFQFPNTSMEGATKWDPVSEKTSDEPRLIFGQTKPVNQRASNNNAPVISALETQLDQARARINELEAERRSSKKKLEQFLQKLSEERAAWRSREHEKIRAIIDDMKTELSREKKTLQRLEIVHSKLVNELTDAKSSMKRYLQEYEKERKSRELLEEVCDELAKEIGEDKAKVEMLKRESVKLWEEVEEERKMLQMAEVWREERAQMKLVDAKVMLEEKYSQMNKIIADLEAFLNSRNTTSSDFLKEVAASVNMQDIRELTYEPPNPDDMFSSVFEDMNFGESRERESPAAKIHTVSPQGTKLVNKEGSNELEDDASEWETLSHPEDQGSSYSPDGSDIDPSSVNTSFRSREWERNSYEKMKRASSISRLWNGRLSNGGNIMSPDCKDGFSPKDLSGSRGIKGCMEWPRNSNAQKSSLKARLLEARMGTQKIQLRQVLKHKI